MNAAEQRDQDRLDVPWWEVQQNPGCPILRVFCEGWDTTNLDAHGRVSNERVQGGGDNFKAPLLNSSQKLRLNLDRLDQGKTRPR
jgi:hypothetical protein